jgi:dienelactone hydrolase
MGGGSSFTAASRHTDIHALVTLSPHNTRPSAILAASLVTVPTLIIGGTKDCITPPEKHQVPMYQSSASIDKTLILIMGAGHCQMVDQNSTCNFGERMKGCKPGISHEDQQKIIYRYLLPWLKFNLLGDIDAGSHFNMDIESDPAIEYMRSRPLSVTCPGNQ